MLLTVHRSYPKMQFKALFSVVVLAATANAAALAEPDATVTLEKRAATIVWFSGVRCTGLVIGTYSDASSGECLSLPNGGSATSISFAGVPNGIQFFVSDNCENGSEVIWSGSGCSTAPAG